MVERHTVKEKVDKLRDTMVRDLKYRILGGKDWLATPGYVQVGLSQNGYGKLSLSRNGCGKNRMDT